MSDVEDLDHEPEDLHLEQELETPADSPEAESFVTPKSGRGAPLKIAAVLAVLVGGISYFIISRSSAPPPVQHEASPLPAPLSSPKRVSSHSLPTLPAVASKVVPPAAPAKKETGTNPLAWNGTSVPSSAPAPVAAITPTTIAPSIVNDLPPPITQLTNAGSKTPAPFTVPSVAPASVPVAAPTSTSTQAPSSFAPASIPAPVVKPVVSAGISQNGITGAASVPVQPAPAKAPEIKHGEAMPAAVVPAVDKAALDNKTPPENALQSAKVEELEKKIADLEKTISQLQQAAVVKEDTVEKPAEEASSEETAPAAAPKKAHHKKASSRHKSRHVSATRWILKAAKPGVAWVARPGSSDLQMVEVGDTIKGIGRVTAIVRDSAGTWMVNGSKGRISQ